MTNKPRQMDIVRERVNGSPPPVVIWGASGHARVVADIIHLQGALTLVGFIDDINPARHGNVFCGARVVGGRDALLRLRDQGLSHVLLGFGDCHMRLDLTDWLLKNGFSLPVAIHPQATVASDVVIGPGAVIVAGAVVNPACRIGSSVIVNTSASVDHECVIGDAAHICPGAHLAGRVTVGEAAQVGLGAVIIQGMCIGRGAVVGAGSVVIGDVPDHSVAYGVPARVRRINGDITDQSM